MGRNNGKGIAILGIWLSIAWMFQTRMKYMPAEDAANMTILKEVLYAILASSLIVLGLFFKDKKDKTLDKKNKEEKPLQKSQ